MYAEPEWYCWRDVHSIGKSRRMSPDIEKYDAFAGAEFTQHAVKDLRKHDIHTGIAHFKAFQNTPQGGGPSRF
jgi:hypothetical protein